MTDAGKELLEAARYAAERFGMWKAPTANMYGALERLKEAVKAADGETATGGYAGVKDAEVNNSLPTQGGGAGDRETVDLLAALASAIGCAPAWTSANDDACADDLAAQVLSDPRFLSALQAAPAAGDRETVGDAVLSACRQYAEIQKWPRERRDIHAGYILTDAIDAILSSLQAAPSVSHDCFECSAPLVGPFCPECNPAIKKALGYPVEEQAAPSEGGEPVAWRSRQRKMPWGEPGPWDYAETPPQFMADDAVYEKQPLYARTPAPSEESSAGWEGALNIVTDPGIVTGLHTAEQARAWIEKSIRAAMLAAAPAPDAIRGGSD